VIRSPNTPASPQSAANDGRWVASLIATAIAMLALGVSLGSGGTVPQSSLTTVPHRPAPSPQPTDAAQPAGPAVPPGTQAAAPTPPAPTPAPATDESPRPLARRVNINSATSAELELLPGVGPAMAARIIEHRRTKGPFRRPADLDSVRGIGEKTLGRLLPLIDFGLDAPPAPISSSP
jgi:competence protein ComEA